MNRLYETEVTIVLDGGDLDVTVRCHVEYGYGIGVGGGPGAALDGDPEVFLDGKWLAVDDVPIDDDDREQIEDALIACALEDDSDVDHSPPRTYAVRGENARRWWS